MYIWYQLPTKYKLDSLGFPGLHLAGRWTESSKIDLLIGWSQLTENKRHTDFPITIINLQIALLGGSELWRRQDNEKVQSPKHQHGVQQHTFTQRRKPPSSTSEDKMFGKLFYVQKCLVNQTKQDAAHKHLQKLHKCTIYYFRWIRSCLANRSYILQYWKAHMVA